MGGTSTISISVNASTDVPTDTQVTLSLGATVSNGTAQFTITPAEPAAENQFSFLIGPGGRKTVIAKYTVTTFSGSPNVQAQCNMSVAGPVVASGSPQTSVSALWIRK